MAIYHLSTKPISRKSGRSSVASSAYRSGTKLEDKRTGLIHDYTRKTGIVSSECFAIKNNEKIKLDRSQVWNIAEEKEKRKDSRTAREIIVNLPHELTKEQRAELVAEFSESMAKKYNVVIDYAIHLPDKEGDQRNHHAHIMMTTRSVDLDKNNNIVLGEKTAIELGNKDLAKLGLPTSQEQIKSMRKEWAETTNRHLAKAELDISIDHRSHKERGLDTLPTIKLGWQASAMERNGIQTEKGNYNRQIQQANNEIKGLQFDIRLLTTEQKLNQLTENAQEATLEREEIENDTMIAEEIENALESNTEQNRGGWGGGDVPEKSLDDRIKDLLDTSIDTGADRVITHKNKYRTDRGYEI